VASTERHAAVTVRSDAPGIRLPETAIRQGTSSDASPETRVCFITRGSR
jgi:hypothetical protein